MTRSLKFENLSFGSRSYAREVVTYKLAMAHHALDGREQFWKTQPLTLVQSLSPERQLSHHNKNVHLIYLKRYCVQARKGERKKNPTRSTCASPGPRKTALSTSIRNAREGILLGSARNGSSRRVDEGQSSAHQRWAAGSDRELSVHTLSKSS